jgi:hypothetical protein
MVEDSEFLKKVLLLALFNRDNDTSIQEVLVELDVVHAISMNDSKELLKEIKTDKLLVEGNFTDLGKSKVDEAQKFFEM